MCGRYRLSYADRLALVTEFGVDPGEVLFEEFSEVRLGGNPFKPRYNVAPSQTMPVVLDAVPGKFSLLRWGLVPWFAKDVKFGFQCINARCETVASKPAFREAWKKRHCLVPADGFFEWQKLDAAGKHKQPFNIGMADDEPFAFAGLWENWRDPAAPPDAEPLRTFTIITGAPNELVAPIHDRMPVILPREKYAAWLSLNTPPDERAAMLTPFPAERMKAFPISPRVGSPKNDDPAIIEPLRTLL